MPDRLGVVRRAGVGVADEVAQPDAAQDVERLTRRQQVEVAADHREVTGEPGGADEIGEPLGLGAARGGVLLAAAYAQAVEVRDRHDAPHHGLPGVAADQVHGVGEPRTPGRRPHLVVGVHAPWTKAAW